MKVINVKSKERILLRLLAALCVFLACLGLFIYFCVLSFRNTGFVSKATPITSFWWSIFALVWSIGLIAVVLTTRCRPSGFARRCGWWTQLTLSSIAIVATLGAGGALFLLGDVAAGAMAVVCVVVLLLITMFVIHHTRKSQDSIAFKQSRFIDTADDEDIEEDYISTNAADRETNSLLSQREEDDRPRYYDRTLESSADDIPYSMSSDGVRIVVNKLRKEKQASRATKFCSIMAILLNILFALVFVLMALACYQELTTVLNHWYHPAPGKFVAVSEQQYKIHIHCDGPLEGTSPTVVMDSGLAAPSTIWSLVQRRVVNTTRICVYDRAGYGYSESGILPRSSNQIAQELRELLEKAGETPPFVLVGHGFGGLNVRQFASMYPNITAGLMLIDAMHEYQDEYIANATGEDVQTIRKSMERISELYRFFAPVGLWRLHIRNKLQFVPQELPADIQELHLTYESTDRFPQAIWSEQQSLAPYSYPEVEASRGSGFGNLPLYVLTAGVSINGTCEDEKLQPGSSECAEFKKRIQQTGPVHYSLQKDLASLSNSSTWEIAWKSRHNMPLLVPRLIADRITYLVTKAQEYCDAHNCARNFTSHT